MISITEGARAKLQQPFGDVLNTHQMLQRARSANGLIISVGDQCTYDLLCAGIKPHICAIDFRCRREPIGEQMKQFLEEKLEFFHDVKNAPGAISDELELAVKSSLSKGQGNILIEGEDDLASLLFIAYAPLGALLIYGQPQQGAVAVEINETIRKTALSILSGEKD